MGGFKPERLRSIRLAAGYGQEDLTAHSGVAQNTISEAETGRRTPRPSTLRKLAAALGVEVRDFYEAADSPKAPREVESYLRSIGADLLALEQEEFKRAMEARLERGTLRAMVSEVSKERADVWKVRSEHPSDPVVIAASKRANDRSTWVVFRWATETLGVPKEEAEEKAAEVQQVLEELAGSAA